MFKTYLFFAGFTDYLALQLCKKVLLQYGGVPLVEFWKRETGSNYSLVFDWLLQMSLGSEKDCIDFLGEISLCFLC